jgi:hypothetical protein
MLPKGINTTGNKISPKTLIIGIPFVLKNIYNNTSNRRKIE